MSTRRTLVALGVSLLSLVAIGVGISGESRPANAIVFAVATPVVCNTGGTCFEAENSGVGIGVEGSVSGAQAVGIEGVGTSKTAREWGVKAIVHGPSGIGVSGTALSTDGFHPSIGVLGTSAGGNGVIGNTTYKSTQAQTAASGVLGQDASTSIFNAGVRGISNAGAGVIGLSTSGIGVSAQGYSDGVSAIGGDQGYGVAATGSVGLEATGVCNEHPICIAGRAIEAVGGDGIVAHAEGDRATGNGGTGLSVGTAQDSMENAFGIFASSYDVAAQLNSLGSAPTLVLSESGGPALIVTGTSGDVASIDGAGNMILKGNLTENGSPLIVSGEYNGEHIGTYSAEESVPTVEDLGEARLIAGHGQVIFDASFRSVANTASNYLAFITPDGDQKGLFVAQKTPAGFVVSEAQGGRDSLVFDYRVVARPLQNAGARLPIVPDRQPKLSSAIIRHASAIEAQLRSRESAFRRLKSVKVR
jgi:hypothetical protein